MPSDVVGRGGVFYPRGMGTKARLRAMDGRVRNFLIQPQVRAHLLTSHTRNLTDFLSSLDVYVCAACIYFGDRAVDLIHLSDGPVAIISCIEDL